MTPELQLLREASNEIKSLRGQNNLMGARLDMFDKCILLLTANIQDNRTGMGEDLVWKIDKFIEQNVTNN